MVPGGIRIRNAESGDADTLYAMGVTEEGFAVSSESRFYTKDYLENWITNPEDDVLLVAEARNAIVGFLFCRVNHNDWAMLENIAVSTSSRRQGTGTALLRECLRRLRERGIDYIAGIVREGNSNLDFFLSSGFVPGHRFVWIERCIKAESPEE
jgi:ribosomal protein S18 acetylase RimI-like enzyme